MMPTPVEGSSSLTSRNAILRWSRITSSGYPKTLEMRPPLQNDASTRLVMFTCTFTRLRSHASPYRSEEHTSELQSQSNLVCRLLLEKKKSAILNFLADSPERKTYFIEISRGGTLPY